MSTYGKSESVAYSKATDCLARYLYLSKIRKEKVPSPSPIKAVSVKKTAKEFKISPEDAYVTMISVDVEEYAKEHFEKTVRKTLTIPKWLNDAATERKINFSKALQDALTELIGK